MFRAERHPSAVIGELPESRDYWRDPDLVPIPPEIHQVSRIHAFVTVDAGTHRATTIGAETTLMAHVHVGHDAIIGDKCELAPGAKVGGHCEIGDGVKIGINATLRPFVKVGALARIGAGAVVIRDVLPGQVVAGNPAKPIRAQGQFIPPERQAEIDAELERIHTPTDQEVYR